MTTTQKSRLATGLSVTALALLLQQPVLAEDAVPVTGATTAPPAEQPSAALAQHPAQAARAAMEERRAAHMAELEKHYTELREQAASRGFEMPPAPPWTEGPQWLTLEEMQARMKAQGISMEPPAPSTAPTPPPMPTPPMGQASPDEQKRIFDTIEKMTPEQQQACFAISRWHTPRVPNRMPPAYTPQRMPQYPPGYVPRYGQPYRGMMRPQ